MTSSRQHEGRQHEALIRRDNTLHVATVRTQPPGPREVLIAPAFVGVCGTDLQILNGARPDIAEILGHEGSGVVVEAGAGAELEVGEHVVFNPAAELHFDRILGHNVPGLFQQLITVSARSLEHGLVLRAQSCAPPTSEALIEPLAAVVYAHELVARATRDLRSVAIFGAGAVGLLAAMYLSSLGIRSVIAHPHRSRLETAVSLRLIDAASAIVASDSLRDDLLAANEHNPFDGSLICSTRAGAPAALACAVDILRNDGCVDLVTNYPENASTPEGLRSAMLRGARAANTCGAPRDGYYTSAVIAGRRLRFTGHRGTSQHHLLTALNTLRADPGRYTKLITHTFTLHEAADAIQTLAHSAERTLNGRDCIKAVVDIAGANGASLS